MEGKDDVVSDILDYIDSNLMEDITIQEIAGTFYFNKHYLMKKFKRSTGITITQYVNSQKVINSMKALAYTDDRILKIALNSGFHSQEYYSEMFEKIVGISPNHFRKKGYFPISASSGGDKMEETKLEKIQRNILELKKLREEALCIKESSDQKKNTSKPKLKVFQRTVVDQPEKKVA